MANSPDGNYFGHYAFIFDYFKFLSNRLYFKN